jgi:hypothetical protein
MCKADSQDKNLQQAQLPHVVVGSTGVSQQNLFVFLAPLATHQRKKKKRIHQMMVLQETRSGELIGFSHHGLIDKLGSGSNVCQCE